MASATTAEATSPSLPRLGDLGVDGATVSFRQPDGSATTVDVRTGAVLQRGGDLHDDWPPPRACKVARGATCAFASGVLVVGQDMALEGGAGAARWKAVHHHYRSNILQQVLEVDGKLLLDSAGFGMATLEGVDMASGKSLWIYAYPSMASYGSGFMGPGTDDVAREREALREFEEYAGQAPLGTVDAATIDTGQGYEGTAVIDPDPLRASLVRKSVLRGWGALVAMLVTVTVVVLRAPADMKRTVALGLLTAALGLLVVVAGHIDKLLTLGLCGGFLAIFIVQVRGTRGAPPRFVLWSIMVATVVGFFLLPVALFWLMR